MELTKLKAFADDKLNMVKMAISLFDKTCANDILSISQNIKFVFHIVENSVGKGENAGYQHFLLFPHCFPRTSSLGSLKVGIVWYRDKVENRKVNDEWTSVQ